MPPDGNRARCTFLTAKMFLCSDRAIDCSWFISAISSGSLLVSSMLITFTTMDACC